MPIESASLPEPRLPDFLVIGAPKAGTTSLHHYLAAHPQIFMAGELGTKNEELNFFITEFNWSLGIEWYREQFRSAGAAISVGEASPRYTQYPYHRGVAERAARVVPDARLIYLIRDPIEQMLSHYSERRRWASERDSVTDALLNNPVYLETARYAFQIDNFLAYFPGDRLHVVISEHLRAPDTRSQTLAGILRFLGVDDAWTSGTLSEEHNVGLAPRRRLIQHLAATRSWEALTAAAPEWLKQPLSPIIHRKTSPRDELADGVVEELVSRLREDVARLREVVGPQVDAWALTR